MLTDHVRQQDPAVEALEAERQELPVVVGGQESVSRLKLRHCSGAAVFDQTGLGVGQRQDQVARFLGLVTDPLAQGLVENLVSEVGDQLIGRLILLFRDVQGATDLCF